LHTRPATPTDLPALHTFYVDTIQNTCKNDYTQEQIAVWVSNIENTARWQEAVASQYFLVAEIDNKIVGFGSLTKGGYIDFMYVHKDHQRQGIANVLLNSLEQEARRLGCACLTSDVSKTARAFFEKKGFAVVKKNRKVMKGLEIVNYRMKKEKL